MDSGTVVFAVVLLARMILPLFIFYEALRLRWNPKRFAMKYWVIAAALIWIVIKLPQEYWIHVAQLDVTDFVKETIFGVPATASFGEAFAAKPWVLAAVVVITLIVWRLMERLPPADHGWRFRADPLPEYVNELSERLALGNQGGRFGRGLIEKMILIGFVSVIFAQILPNVRSSNVAIIAQVAVIIAVNALFSQWLVRRRIGWESGVLHFLSMLAVNVAILVAELFLLATRAPALTRWHMRGKVLPYYRQLRKLELVLPTANLEQTDAGLKRLAELAQRVRVSVAYLPEVYQLRLHVRYVASELEARKAQLLTVSTAQPAS